MVHCLRRLAWKEKITNHIVAGDSANHQLKIEVLDGPGAGGANHLYQITGFTHPSDFAVHLSFQNGPIKEFGVNGVTQEALLAIVIDRLRSFQEGPFACDDNDEALRACKQALSCLQRRTVRRIERGVEGTHAQ